jgi:beta-galactosidase
MMAAVMMLSMGVFQATAASYAGEEWYDKIDVVQVNREPARAFFVPYQNREVALANEASAFTRDFSKSSYYLSLNGLWKFQIVSKPDNRINGFEAVNYDDTSWDSISVPSSWQTVRDERGFPKYDNPIYVNQRYPWANYESVVLSNPHAPTVYNPVGHYRRTFELPADWDGREVFVSFQGVESAFYLWVNGQYVGYSEDSYTPAEFDLTPYLQPGENQIAAQVYRWSTGSYLENQDFIRLSGIFRDVFLYAKEKVELRDFFVTTDLDSFYENANLNLEVSLRNFSNSRNGNYIVEAALLNMDDTPVWAAPLRILAPLAAADDNGPAQVTTKGSKWVAAPKKWFADTPNLYKLLIELKAPDGRVIETAVQRIGFREINKAVFNDAGQEILQINGKRIVLRGTNRHEASLENGRAVTPDEIIRDLFLMKQYNINAIRTSHYPNNVLTYALADELGLYVCDEANIESHYGATSGDIPSGLPIWTNSVVDRMKSMVERDKNAACVIIWSLGNEATYKTYTLNNNYTMYVGRNWIAGRDRTRVIKYERDNRDALVDIQSVQYPSISYIPSYAKNTANKKPLIMSEYEHSMGNAMGSFTEYWDEFRTYPNAQGGFIWDFVDQSIWMPTAGVPEVYTTDGISGVEGSITGALETGRGGTQAVKGTVTYPVDSKLNAASDKITIETWVNPAPTGSTHGDIVSKGDNGLTLKGGSEQIEFFVDGYGSGTATCKLPANWFDGTWKQLVAVYDGTQAAAERYKLYIDGENVATARRNSAPTADSSASATQYPLSIGYNPQYTGRNFSGLIDAVHIYKTALTADQIKDTSRTAADPNVVYWNDFGENNIRIFQPQYDEDTYNAYGGDWGETVTDNSFSGNGIFFANRDPKPVTQEVKKAHQEVWFEAADLAKGKVKITNEFLNTPLSRYNHTWVVKEDNKVVSSGTLDLDVAPLASTVVEIDTGSLDVKPGAEYFLEFTSALKEDEVWAEAGHVIASAQFELPIGVRDDAFTLDPETVPAFTDVTESDTEVIAKGEQFQITFDKTKAEITSFVSNGKELLQRGPFVDPWRAPGDNDTGYDSNYKNAWANARIDGLRVRRSGNIVDIEVNSTLTGARSAKNVTRYTIYGTGDVVVNNALYPGANSTLLLRVGMKMYLAETLRNMEYYGRGPMENYSDRNVGSPVGVYAGRTEDQYVPYLRPQFFGNRTDVRWISVTDDEGAGLLVTARDLISAGASNYDEKDFEGLRHMYLAPKSPYAILNIDYAQAGVGSAACGPATLAKYQLPGSGSYEYTYRLTPIGSADTTDAKMAESKRLFDVVRGEISAIYVNGKPLNGFDANVTAYTHRVLTGGAAEIPAVTVSVPSTVSVEVTQPESPEGTATVRATVDGETKIYTIAFQQVDQIYASDIDWLRAEAEWDYVRRDQKTEGTAKITITMPGGANQVFDKGIGAHAYSEVLIDIESLDADMFEAWVGVDVYQRSPNADLEFLVYVDDVLTFQSGIMKYLTPAKRVQVPVTGAKRLLLVTTLGSDNRNANDHADWADAKFTKFTPTEVSALRFDEESKTVSEGNEFPLRAVSVCDDGKEALLPVTWTILQEEETPVLALQENGNPAVFRALQPGQVQIKAASVMDPEVFALYTVVVEAEDVAPPDDAVTGVQASLGSLILRAGESHQLRARVLPDHAANRGYTWARTKGSNVTFTENEDGSLTVYARSEGTSVFTVTSDEGGFTDQCVVTVVSGLSASAVVSEADEDIVVDVTIRQSDPDPVALLSVAAVYGEDGRLLAVDTQACDALGQDTLTFRFDASDFPALYTVKAFTWARDDHTPLLPDVTAERTGTNAF